MRRSAFAGAAVGPGGVITRHACGLRSSVNGPVLALPASHTDDIALYFGWQQTCRLDTGDDRLHGRQ